MARYCTRIYDVPSRRHIPAKNPSDAMIFGFFERVLDSSVGTKNRVRDESPEVFTISYAPSHLCCCIYFHFNISFIIQKPIKILSSVHPVLLKTWTDLPISIMKLTILSATLTFTLVASRPQYAETSTLAEGDFQAAGSTDCKQWRFLFFLNHS